MISMAFSGMSYAMIAREYSLSTSMVRAICHKVVGPRCQRVDEQLARELYNAGCTDREIARQIGCNEKTVANWRRKCGLATNVSSSVSEVEAEVMSLYQSGQSDVEIASRVGVDRGGVRRWRILNGLPVNRARTGPKRQNVDRDATIMARLAAGGSYTSVAAALGISRGTVAGASFRARCQERRKALTSSQMAGDARASSGGGVST